MCFFPSAVMWLGCFPLAWDWAGSCQNFLLNFLQFSVGPSPVRVCNLIQNCGCQFSCVVQLLILMDIIFSSGIAGNSPGKASVLLATARAKQNM